MKDIMSWNELEVGSTRQELNDWYIEAERELQLPQEWVVHYGKWDQFKTYMEGIIDSYESRIEERDDIKLDLENLQRKYDNLVEGLEEIKSDIEMIPWQDIPDTDTPVNDCVKAIDKLILGYEKPKKKKRK